MKEIFKKWFDGQVNSNSFERSQLTGDIAWEILKIGRYEQGEFVFYSTMFISLTKDDIESLTADQIIWLTDNLPTEFSHFCNK